MPENGLIMIAPVRAGEERELARALDEFGRPAPRACDVSPAQAAFAASASIHFARFALLPDPDRGPGRMRLLVATDFDGPLEAHLRELVQRTQRPEPIWSRLEGCDEAAGFREFVRRHTVQPGAWYRAFPDDTLPEMRDAIEMTAQFQGRLAERDIERRHPGLAEVLRVGRFLQSAWRCVSGPPAFALRAFLTAFDVMVLVRRLGLFNVLSAACRINATLNRVWWIRPFNFLLRNRHSPPPHPYSEADPRRHFRVDPGEDAVLQNQLTLVTEVAPEYLPQLKAVLALIDLYGRRLSTPGSLVGISTIHTVRWAILDQGRRLLMVSNYDNTWENYIDEFAEMILSGLDALWRSAPDYPRAGAQDVAALKQFLRANQIRASVFYSAVPETSILNLKEALPFAAWFGTVLRWMQVVPPASGASMTAATATGTALPK